MGLAKHAYDWELVTPIPPREVFASMEQLVGTRPYRFEIIGENAARVVEHSRRGFFGQWSRPRLRIRWVSCETERITAGTRVRVTCSGGGGLIAKALGKADGGPLARALQLVNLLARGRRDQRTIYRERPIPPGPITLVASWAGMGYRVYERPDPAAPRGAEVLTATLVEAIPGGTAEFVHVRLADGAEGYIERDQIVAAPLEATREAQTEAAQFV